MSWSLLSIGSIKSNTKAKRSFWVFPQQSKWINSKCSKVLHFWFNSPPTQNHLCESLLSEFKISAKNRSYISSNSKRKAVCLYKNGFSGFISIFENFLLLTSTNSWWHSHVKKTKNNALNTITFTMTSKLVKT